MIIFISRLKEKVRAYLISSCLRSSGDRLPPFPRFSTCQMKISEQDFINGKIDITALSLERGRRSSAVITYQEGRAALHNAVTLLEMLTNVKIINRSSQEK
jgi:hypothetical protein